MLYRQLVPGAMGIAGAAKTELMPRKYAAAQNFFTVVIRTLTMSPQGAAVFSPNACERRPIGSQQLDVWLRTNLP